jgi:concentrative nucleoside transporter, CNT family
MLSRDKKPTPGPIILDFEHLWSKPNSYFLPLMKMLRGHMSNFTKTILLRSICIFAIGLGLTPANAQNGTPVPPRESEQILPEPVVQPADPFSEVEILKDQSRGEALASAKILHKLGDHARASAILRGLLKQSTSGDLSIHQLLRRVLIDAQQPGHLAGALVGLVRSYQAHGNNAQALATLNELKVISPNHSDIPALNQEIAPLKKEAQVDDGYGRYRSFLGILVFLGIAYLLSSNRKAIRYRIVFWGIGLQFLFAFIILWSPPGRLAFDAARTGIEKILSFTDAGSSFLFGNLYNGIAASGGAGPVQYVDGSTGDLQSFGVIFAFHILPTVIFFGTLMAVLYHLGLIQKIVQSIAWLMSKTMGTSGSESLSAAGNIFVGQTEAPLLIKPYVGGMTVSELMAVMVGGFATVAGGVLAAYARFGIDPGHLLAASVMSAPAALVVAKILYPETELSKTQAGNLETPQAETKNILDAATTGASDGLKLALNVGAMLLAFISLVAMLDWMLGGVGSLLGFEALSLSYVFGLLFYPLSWCMGVDIPDLMTFGQLLGTKIAINEFVAFVDLGAASATMSPRSTTIATYALCGFANFSSIGIQIGGISSIAPERRSELAMIGLKAMAGGAMASWLTACVAGLLL